MEIHGTRQEVLAAALEKEFLELKHRVEKIESRSIS